MSGLSLVILPVVIFGASFSADPAGPGDHDPAYYHEGDLAGSLRSDAPLPLYGSDPEGLANRLFAAIAIRSSELPSNRGGAPITRIEGGDTIDFLAWGGTQYWSAVTTCQRIEALLDEALARHDSFVPRDAIRRAILQRDLWAVFDHYVSRNIAREGDLVTRRRRDALCGKLARAIRLLALPADGIAGLPATYEAAIRSGRFAPAHEFNPAVDYLPQGLLSNPDEWQEIDFFQPDLHEDLAERFVTLHTRAFQARSYFRVFYRFPGGRPQLETYLRHVEERGIDWKTAAQNGFIALTADVDPLPVGTEVALLQFLLVLDDHMQPVPTPICESVRLRIYRNSDGSERPVTNTGVGMNVLEYTLKRRLLFDNQRQGGLAREPDHQPIYRVIFQSPKAPDWGPNGRWLTLAEDCRRCHTGGGQVGAQTIFSMVHQGGFDAGAQLGVARPLKAGEPSPRANRAVVWKTRHETYRRLLEYVGL